MESEVARLISWVLPIAGLSAYGLWSFNVPPTRRSESTRTLFLLGSGLYVLAILVLWLLVFGTLGAGSHWAGLGHEAQAPQWLERFLPTVAAVVAVLPIQEKYAQINARVRHKISELVSIGSAVNQLMVAVNTSPFVVRDNYHREKIEREARTHGLDPDDLAWVNDDSVGSKITQTIALKELFFPSAPSADESLSKKHTSFRQRFPNFIINHGSIVSDLQKRYRKLASQFSDAVMGKMSDGEYSSFYRRLTALLRDLRSLAIRAALSKSRSYSTAQSILNDFFYETSLRPGNIQDFVHSAEMFVWAFLLAIGSLFFFFSALSGFAILDNFVDRSIRISLIAADCMIAGLSGYFFAKLAAERREGGKRAVVLIPALLAVATAVVIASTLWSVSAWIQSGEWGAQFLHPWRFVTAAIAAGVFLSFRTVRLALAGDKEAFARGFQRKETKYALLSWLLVAIFSGTGYALAYIAFVKLPFDSPPANLTLLTGACAAIITSGIAVFVGFILIWASRSPAEEGSQDTSEQLGEPVM